MSPVARKKRAPRLLVSRANVTVAQAEDVRVQRRAADAVLRGREPGVDGDEGFAPQQGGGEERGAHATRDEVDRVRVATDPGT